MGINEAQRKAFDIANIIKDAIGTQEHRFAFGLS
jgi:hypothetical protein